MQNKEIMAIKLIKAENYNEYQSYIQEKFLLISLFGKGNFPIIHYWNYSQKYIYLA